MIFIFVGGIADSLLVCLPNGQQNPVVSMCQSTATLYKSKHSTHENVQCIYSWKE